MDATTEFFYYRAPFLSAYYNNKNNIELALYQVSQLHDVEIEHLRTVLRLLINSLKEKEIKTHGI